MFHLSKNSIIQFTAIVSAAFLALQCAGAAAPRLTITWETRNFYPSDFEGKALPITNTRVTASALVTKDGAILDGRDVTFTWYVDDEWLGQEVGKREVAFSVSKLFGDSQFVRAVALLTTGERIEASVRIPIASPTLVLETQAKHEGETAIRAVPFFFNVNSLTELSFSWEINGTKQTESANSLVVPSGNTISVTAKNSRNSLEFTKNSINL